MPGYGNHAASQKMVVILTSPRPVLLPLYRPILSPFICGEILNQPSTTSMARGHFKSASWKQELQTQMNPHDARFGGEDTGPRGTVLAMSV
jgi:hypothetical protein